MANKRNGTADIRKETFKGKKRRNRRNKNPRKEIQGKR
jgi:hypothetical protein